MDLPKVIISKRLLFHSLYSQVYFLFDSWTNSPVTPQWLGTFRFVLIIWFHPLFALFYFVFIWWHKTFPVFLVFLVYCIKNCLRRLTLYVIFHFSTSDQVFLSEKFRLFAFLKLSRLKKIYITFFNASSYYIVKYIKILCQQKSLDLFRCAYI